MSILPEFQIGKLLSVAQGNIKQVEMWQLHNVSLVLTYWVQ